MGFSAESGPLVIHGPGAANGTLNLKTLPITPDSGPSLSFASVGLFDPRYPYKGGGGTENSALLAIGFGPTGGFTALDQAPSTAVVNNIAVAAHPTSGTAMTLVSSSGAGITVMTSALFVPQTGNTVPTGKLVIDTLPGLVKFGSCGSIAIADPAKAAARAVSITASSGGVGGAFLVSGYDLYGYPQTEKITAASSPSGATTTNGKKAFKFINTVTPQVTDTFNYSIGTADIFGFPLRCDTFPYTVVGFAGAIIASSTGFVAADTTTATNTTGDVRGTYTVQSVSNGVKTLQMFQTISPANISTITGMFGVLPA